MQLVSTTPKESSQAYLDSGTQEYFLIKTHDGGVQRYEYIVSVFGKVCVRARFAKFSLHGPTHVSVPSGDEAITLARALPSPPWPLLCAPVHTSYGEYVVRMFER